MLFVNMLRECKSDGNAGVGDVIAGGICGSSIVSSAADVLGVIVMSGMKSWWSV